MGLYLYGIMEVAEPETWSPPAGVEAVMHRGLAALVRPWPEGAAVIEPTAALAHGRVLEEAMRAGTVLPCRFGTVAGDEAEVRGLLRDAEDLFRETVTRVKGKEEAGLKAFWRPEAVRREVEREVGQLGRLGEVAGDPRTARQVAITVGQSVERVVEDWKRRLVPAIVEHLRPWCCDLRENRPFGPRMLLNLALLVERGREGFLREAVLGLDGRFGSQLEFRYVAGLPPYSFVDLRIESLASRPSSVGDGVGDG